MQRLALLVLAISLSGCGIVGVIAPPNDRAPGTQPVGEITPLGVVVEEGTGRVIAYEGFDDASGLVCIRSGVGSTCRERGAQLPGLPATEPDSLSYAGGDGAWCVEAELQVGVANAMVKDSLGIGHLMTALPAAREMHVNLYVSCWTDGGFPSSIDTYDETNTLIYSTDL